VGLFIAAHRIRLTLDHMVLVLRVARHNRVANLSGVAKLRYELQRQRNKLCISVLAKETLAGML
jgi:hypothetical protein